MVISCVSAWFTLYTLRDFFFQEKISHFVGFYTELCFHTLKNFIIVNNNEDCITDIVREGPCVPKYLLS